MAPQHILNVDLAAVYTTASKDGFIRTLAWGDDVEVLKQTPKHLEIGLRKFTTLPDGSIKPRDLSGFIVPPASSKIKPADLVLEKKDDRVLKVDFVDVQQGDGSVIETPAGKLVLVDGGDNQLFARYLAGRHYLDTSAGQPKPIDCILVTHGDADHFAGLAQIHESETHDTRWKRFFMQPLRVYHNGLVKRPDKKDGKARKETDMLGETKVVDGKTIITGLVTNLLDVPNAELNKPFREWKNALQDYQKRGPIQFRHLQKGDDAAFDFLSGEGIRIEVLGPIPTRIGSVEGLEFLGAPKKGPRVGHESLATGEADFSGFSASHTINGHSIVFRLVYGDFSFLFTGDLNDQAGRALVRDQAANLLTLRSEVFKVPHHGSADFSGAFLQAVSPVISIVSSGDESSRKEYIHPRATLMGALGRSSRVEEPLIFVTELVAFFQMEGFVKPEFHELKEGVAVVKNGQAVLAKKAQRRFFAFSRAAFGIVKVRTDGKRLMIYTNSGQADLKEAYAYEMDADKKPAPVTVRQV